jgi:hypothetical protein
MMWMLSYKTVLLAQTGICATIHPMAFRNLDTGFINKCIDDVIPTVTVHTYPNQKPWITGNIHTELEARAAAFKEWDNNLDAYKTLRQTIKQLANYHKLQRESQLRAVQ